MRRRRRKLKSKSKSKTIINCFFIVFAFFGIFGSFVSIFDMNKYVDFLKIFSVFFGPLVLAVSGGRSFKNFLLYKEKMGSLDDLDKYK